MKTRETASIYPYPLAASPDAFQNLRVTDAGETKG